jgi:drug/metabolite transporter (DMT)-like permease
VRWVICSIIANGLAIALLAASGLHPAAAASASLLLGGALLALIALWRSQAAALRPRLWAVLCGLCAAAATSLLVIGAQLASVGSVMFASMLVSSLAALLVHARLRPALIAAAMCGIASAALLARSVDQPAGLALGALAAVFIICLYQIIRRRLQGCGADIALASQVMFWAGLALSPALLIGSGHWSPLWLGLAALVSALSYTALLRSLACTRVRLALLVRPLGPVVGALAAWPLLDQQLDWSFLLAALLALVAVGLASWER